MDRLQGMELFSAAARLGSFSEAARKVGLSPASVSRIIGDLESHLRVQLFNRTSRSLALTEAGETYLQRIEPLLDGLRGADAAVGAFQQRPTGRLRVHSRLMFGNRVVAPLIPAFQSANPDVQFIENVDIGAEHANRAIDSLNKGGQVEAETDGSGVVFKSGRSRLRLPAKIGQMRPT